jgi:hypothetical protein
VSPTGLHALAHTAHRVVTDGFSFSVDLTGVATVLLALATLWVAKSTAQSAAAAVNAADTAAKQARDAVRPLLAMVVDPDPHASGPLGDSDGQRATIAVRNIGTGPALDVTVGLTYSAANQPQAPENPQTIAVGDRVELSLLTFGATEVHTFSVLLSYSDVIGVGYRTTATWHPAQRRYETHTSQG